jgi:hypothetical protein
MPCSTDVLQRLPSEIAAAVFGKHQKTKKNQWEKARAEWWAM